MAKVLSPEQAEQYDRDGYLCPFTAFPVKHLNINDPCYYNPDEMKLATETVG